MRHEDEASRLEDLFPLAKEDEEVDISSILSGGGSSSGSAPPKAPSSPVIGPLPSVVEAPYNPEKQHDLVRTLTTFGFIFVFALTILAALYVVIWRNTSWSQTKELLDLLLPAETALIGSAVGFYFGSKAIQADH